MVDVKGKKDTLQYVQAREVGHAHASRSFHTSRNIAGSYAVYMDYFSAGSRNHA